MSTQEWLSFLELCRLTGKSPEHADNTNLWVNLWNVNRGARHIEELGHQYNFSSLETLAQTDAYAKEVLGLVKASMEPESEAPSSPPAPPAPPAPPIAEEKTLEEKAPDGEAPVEQPSSLEGETKSEAEERLSMMLGRPDTTSKDMPPIGDDKQTAASDEKPKKRKRRTKAEIAADKEKERKAEEEQEEVPSSNTEEEITSEHMGSEKIEAPDNPSALPDLSNIPSEDDKKIQEAAEVGKAFDPKMLRVLKELAEHKLSQCEAVCRESSDNLEEAKKRLEEAETHHEDAKNELSFVRSTLRVVTQLLCE